MDSVDSYQQRLTNWVFESECFRRWMISFTEVGDHHRYASRIRRVRGVTENELLLALMPDWEQQRKWFSECVLEG